MIKNKDGDKVEISSLTDAQVEELNHWHDLQLVSPQEAMIGFLATAPHADEIEENKKLAAKCEKIQNKMLSGQKLKPDEKIFLRENYPELAAKAEQMELQAEQLEKQLKARKSNDAANKIYLEAKMNVLSGLNEKDGSALFILAALDETFNRHRGRNTSYKKIDIVA